MQSPTVGPPSSSQTDESPTSILNPSANSGSASTLDNQKGRTIDDIFDAIGKDISFFTVPLKRRPDILNSAVAFRNLR